MNVLVIGCGSIGSQHFKPRRSLAGKHDLAVPAFGPSRRRATDLTELKSHLREARFHDHAVDFLRLNRGEAPTAWPACSLRDALQSVVIAEHLTGACNGTLRP